jgi:hypothetical protein
MHWLTNMLPAERRLYIGVMIAALFTIACFIATAHM